ncbi:hypothetical protein ACLB2K_000724 [Fragaria x ananassa]
MTATLCLKATRSFLNPRPFSGSLSPPKPHRHLLSFPKTLATVTMSSSPVVVEHVVLFNVKPDTDPSKVNSMVNGLNNLTSLDLTLHLTAGPLLRTRSSPFAFTHLLHSRYSSKDSLAAYSAHPGHLSVVKESVLPICDDVMAVKEGLDEAAKGEILEVIKGIKGKFGEVGQISVGENFSPARAKGYSIASVAVFKGVSEMEAVDSKEELAKLEKDKVREYLESVIVLDYVVPSPQSASL